MWAGEEALEGFVEEGVLWLGLQKERGSSILTESGYVKAQASF